MREILCARDVTYVTRSGRQILKGLSLSIGSEKAGLVGRNGVGKSTLLSLLAGRLAPDEGTCERLGKVSYVPQVLPETEEDELRRMLGAARDAAKRHDDPRMRRMLLSRIGGISPGTLRSGGEQKILRILLAFSEDSDFVLLDEPECGLDIENRRLLRALIRATAKGILMVSHDGSLLNEMEAILELREQGIRKFTGDFDAYRAAVSAEAGSLDRKVRKVGKELRDLRDGEGKAVSNQLYRMKKGAHDMLENGYGDFSCDIPKEDRASRTLKRLKKKYEEKEREGRGLMEEYIDRATLASSYSLPVPEVEADPERLILEVRHCSFAYGKGREVLADFSLSVRQGEKVALVGRNGIGKTTLLRLIAGQLQGTGEIVKGWRECAYLDQFLEAVDPEESLIQNIQREYGVPDASDVARHVREMGFPEPQAARRMRDLSGGELVIASLLFLFWRETPPDLLLLDEPASHLDIAGVNLLANLINSYKGAVILISHDEGFLGRIRGARVVEMEGMHERSIAGSGEERRGAVLV